MACRALLSVVTLAFAFTGMGTRADSPGTLQHQADTPAKAPGKIEGKISPRVGIGFDVSLNVPGSNRQVTFATVDALRDRWKFTLDNIPPGTYQLVINHLPVSGCGIGSWAGPVSVRSGETVQMKVKLKVDHNARCE
jgi:hypothetical protein